ncbi:PilN domain-containing protein [Vibrio breoganii]
MINLLPWREEQAYQQKWRFFTRVSVPSLLTILGFIVVSFLERQYQHNLEFELNILQSEVIKVKTIYADETQENNEQALWQKRLTRLQNQQRLRQLPLPIDVLPDKSSIEGVSLLALHCLMQECVIEGSVEALYQLRPFIDGLASEAQVRHLQIEQLMPIVTEKGEGSNQFKISFQLGSHSF